jgi:hypothetical protein
MRLFLISLAIALLAMLPEAAGIREWDVPGVLMALARVPSAGFGYMGVFFHELGHTVVFWSYGQAAVPMFNFTDGGGFAQPLGERSYILLGIVYLCWVAFIFWLFANGGLRYAVLLLALLGIHACFAGGERYMLPVNYLGNGGAVLTGCFCIWRAALNKTVAEQNAEAERYVHMIFGLYVVLSQGLGLGFELMTDPIGRAAYAEGIGSSHIANDFTVIADRLDISIRRVGAFHFAFTFLSLLVTGVLILFGLRAQEDEAADIADAAATPQLRGRPRK